MIASGLEVCTSLPLGEFKSIGDPECHYRLSLRRSSNAISKDEGVVSARDNIFQLLLVAIDFILPFKIWLVVSDFLHIVRLRLIPPLCYLITRRCAHIKVSEEFK